MLAQREGRLTVYISIAALALGFAVFIAIQAPIRQQMIIENQTRIIDTLQQLEVEVQLLSKDLQRHADREQ